MWDYWSTRPVPMLIRKLCRCKENIQTKHTAEIIRIGKQRVESHFDILNYIKQMREFQIFLASIITHRQRLLMNCQRSYLISKQSNACSFETKSLATLKTTFQGMQQAIRNGSKEAKSQAFNDMHTALAHYK